MIERMMPCEALWIALTAGGLKRSARAPTCLSRSSRQDAVSVGQKRLHDDGSCDGIGERLKKAESEALKELLLATQKNAHAGLRVVLEVKELPELNEDVVG